MLKQVVTLAVSQTPQILLSRIDCLSQLKIIFPIIEIVNKDIVQNRGYLCADNKMKQFSVGQPVVIIWKQVSVQENSRPLTFPMLHNKRPSSKVCLCESVFFRTGAVNCTVGVFFPPGLIIFWLQSSLSNEKM
jgi:hypothetical protein